MADTRKAVAVKAADAPVSAIGHGAVLHAIERNTTSLELPRLGIVRLPSPDALASYGGLVTLAAVGVMEWPVALAIGVGHLLAQSHHIRLLHDFGEALEEA
ncbi:MAG: hypothetical protein ACXVXP_07335 [Mycobacteriaceae bacterium]